MKDNKDFSKLEQELLQEFDSMTVKEVEELLGVQPFNYKEGVQQSVEEEFQKFHDQIIEKTPEEIFLSNYEIHIKSEIKETLVSINEDWLPMEYWYVLYKDKGSILHILYDEYLSYEEASVHTMSATIEWITDACDYNYADSLEAFRIASKYVEKK